MTTRILHLSVVAVGIVMAFLVAGAGSARANHPPAASFAGDLASNGTLRFTISSDGAQLESWSVQGARALECDTPMSFSSTGPVPITGAPTGALDHQAVVDTVSNNVRVSLRIAFPYLQGVSGTLSFNGLAGSVCPNGNNSLNFTARRVDVTAVTPTTVVPNGPYQPGVNAVAVIGADTAAGIAAKIGQDSGRPVQALWSLVGGAWRYYLPALPTVDGGLSQVLGPASSIIAILG